MNIVLKPTERDLCRSHELYKLLKLRRQVEENCDPMMSHAIYLLDRAIAEKRGALAV